MNNINFQVTELTLLNLILLVWKRRLMVFSFALSFAIIGTALSFTVNKTFRAESTLIPAERYSGTMNANRTSARLGSMMMGLSNSSSEIDYVVLGVETIKSRSFIKNFLKDNNLEPYYSVIKSYDLASDKFIFDQDLYDNELKDWTKTAKENELVPPDVVLYKNFMKRTVFTRDLANNTLKLYTIHESPSIARNVNYLLIEALNKSISDFDSNIASNSMIYIGERLANTDGSELREMLSGMYVKELEKQMLTEVQEEYVFRTLDPPVLPKFKYRPSRFQFLLVSLILGIFVSISVILFQSIIISPRKKEI